MCDAKKTRALFLFSRARSPLDRKLRLYQFHQIISARMLPFTLLLTYTNQPAIYASLLCLSARFVSLSYYLLFCSNQKKKENCSIIYFLCLLFFILFFSFLFIFLSIYFLFVLSLYIRIYALEGNFSERCKNMCSN